MNNRFFLNNKSRKKILAVVILVVLLVALFSTSSFALDGQQSQSLLGSSGTLGASGEFENVKLLFQISELEDSDAESKTLSLAFVGDVADVKMTTPEGKEEIKDVPADDSPTLGESAPSEEPAIKPFSLVPAVDTDSTEKTATKVKGNATLGYSDGSIQEIDDSLTLETDSKVEFDLSEVGDYYFDLFNNEGDWIAQFGPITPFSGPGVISLDYHSTTPAFKLIGPTTVSVGYQPIDNNKTEKIKIILPPFWSNNGLPTEPGVTFTSYTIPLPETHYYPNPSTNPIDKLMQDYALANPTATECTVIEGTIAATIKENISMTVNMELVGMGERYLSELMVYFGTDPDKIPLRIIAESYSNTDVLLSFDSLDETSVLNTPAPEPNLAFPNQNQSSRTSIIFDTYNLVVSENQSTQAFNLSKQHYPYSKVFTYSPLVPGTYDPLNPPPNTKVINGQTYVGTEIKTGTAAADTPEFLLFNKTLSPQYRFSAQIPTVDVIKPGDVYGPFDMYFDAVYKGASFLNGPQKIYTMDAITIPEFFEPPQVLNFSALTGSGYNSHEIYRTQDTVDDYRIMLDNLANSYLFSDEDASTKKYIPAAYEDVTFTMEFPYAVNPTKLSWGTGASVGNQNTRHLPTNIKYTYFDGTTGNITPPSNSLGVPFPQSSEHIVKVELSYDVLLYNTKIYFFIDAENGTESAPGVPLGAQAQVKIKTALTTASGNRVEQYGLKSQGGESYTALDPALYSKDHPFYLVGAEDNLRFGTAMDTANSAATHSGMTTGVFKSYNSIATGYTTSSFEKGPTYSSPWQIAFSNAGDKMQDYKNVVITVKPTDQESLKAMSKIAAIQLFNGWTKGKSHEKFEVYGRTNLDSNLRLINQSNSTIILLNNLNPKEYFTEIEIHFGTVYGETFSSTHGLFDTGERIQSSDNKMFYFLLDDDAYFYPDIPAQKEKVTSSHHHTLQATISTDTYAESLNPATTGFYNTTSTGQIKYLTSGTLNIAKLAPSSTLDIINIPTFYRGNIATIGGYMRTQGSIDTTSLSLTFNFLGIFPTYDHQFYIEIKNGFTLLGIEDYDYVSQVPLTDSTLYIFENTTATNKMDSFNMSLYINSDADVGLNVSPIVGVGVNYSLFSDRHMQPNTGGSDDYYNKSPYLNVVFKGTRFPASWGADPATTPYQLYHDVGTRIKFHVGNMAIDRLLINPVVEGRVFPQGSGPFNDHQKTNDLSVSGTIVNGRDAHIPGYQSTFSLPKDGIAVKGTDREDDGGSGGGPVPIKDFIPEFDMSLNGPIDFGSNVPDQLTVAYYGKTGNLLGDHITNPTNWADVYSFVVDFENFQGNSSYSFTLPVSTDYSKIGDDVTPVSSFIGAVSKKMVSPGVYDAEAYSYPVEFIFESYGLDVRIGLDKNEDGSMSSLLADEATVNIYYDNNGTETLLHTETIGSSFTFEVNADVSKVEVIPNNPTVYGLTKETASGISEIDNSDILRDDGFKLVDANDLIQGNKHRYDANLYVKHTVTAPDIIIKTTDTNIPILPIIGLANNQPATLEAQYSKAFTDAEDIRIATVTTDGKANGVAKGVTYYTVTVENLLGNKVTARGKITVEPDYVQSSLTRKELELGTRNLQNGDFSFKMWAQDTTAADDGLSTAQTFTGIVIDNSNTLTSNFEKGVRYFVNEVNLPDGYALDHFSVTIDGSTTTPLPLDANGYYYFDIPVTAGSVTVTAHNTNDFATMTVAKQLAPNNPVFNDGKTFPINIVESSGSSYLHTMPTQTLTIGATSSITDFIVGMEYTVTEDSVQGYELREVKILDSSGTEIAGAVTKSGNSYTFTFKDEYNGGTLAVVNQVLHGHGLELTKLVESTTLSFTEPFTFKLVGDNTVEAYGKVTYTGSATTVSWFSDSAMTVPYDATYIPYGRYTLTETSATANFELDKFEVTAGTVDTSASSDTVIVFDVDVATTELLKVTAHNRTLRSGSVNVTKVFDDTNFKNDSFTFILTHSSGKTYESTKANVTTGTQFNSWEDSDGTTYTNNLPLGKYTLTEKDTTADPASHFEFDKFDDDGSGNYTLSSSDQIATFTLENTTPLTSLNITANNKLKTGKLEITKTISGNLLGTALRFDFEVYQYDIGGSHQKIGGTHTISLASGVATGSVTVSGLEYGEYFVRELDHADYELTTPSSVITQTGTPTAANIGTLESDSYGFNATNKLKKSTRGISVIKVATDGLEIPTAQANTFTFELRDNSGIALFTGKAMSNDPSIATGISVQWVRDTNYDNGRVDISGTSITGLDYGTYTIVETSTGADFRIKDLTGDPALGTASADKTTFTIKISTTTENPATNNTVTFENERRFIKTSTIIKDFDGTDTNFRDKTFTFEYQALSGITSPQTITGVTESIPKDLVLEKGVTYKIFEKNIPEGYQFKEFKITSNSTTVTNPITVTDKGTHHEFDVPNDATEVSIVAVNINDVTTMQVEKALSGSYDLLPNALFNISVTESGVTAPSFQKTNMKVGDNETAQNLVVGLSYIVKEVPDANFELVDVRIVNPVTGTAVGTPPAVQPDGSYLFTLESVQQNAKILVTNRMRTGNGLQLTKKLEPTELTKEDFTFEITGPNGFTAYGHVESGISTFNTVVKWYSSPTFGAANLIDITALPIGGPYTVTETSNNMNFILDKFTVDSGTATVPSDGQSLTFNVTDPGTLVTASAYNIPRSTGKVTVNKTFTLSMFDQDSFTFTLIHAPSGKTYTSTKIIQNDAVGNTIVFDSWTDSGGTTFTNNLPLGEYSIKETQPGTHYMWEGFAADPYITLTNNDETATFILTEDPSMKKHVVLSGHNELGNGTIKITKEVTGTLGGLPKRDFYFDLFRIDSFGKTQIDISGPLDVGLTRTVEFTPGDLSTNVTVTLQNMPYGEYYLEEHLDGMFLLLPNSSNVNEPNEATPKTLTLDSSNSATIEFRAVNKLKTSTNNLIAYKSAPPSTGFTANQFKFELYDVLNNVVIYDGVVQSSDTNISTGARVEWTMRGAHQNGNIAIGTNNTEIEELIYGEYVVREVDSGTEYELDYVDSREPNFGQAEGTNGWKITLNRNTDLTVGDIGMTFYNKLKQIGSIKVNKSVDGGNTFPDAQFIFSLLHVNTGATYTGKGTELSGVTAWIKTGTTTPVSTLALGEYVVTETPDSDFNLKEFINPLPTGTVSATSATLRLSSASPIAEVTAVNTVKTGAQITVKKEFESGYNHNTSSTFTFNLYGPEIAGQMPLHSIITVDSSTGWSKDVTGLTYGKYRLVEDLTNNTDYVFVSMTDGINTVSSTDGTIKALNFIISGKTGGTIAPVVTTVNKVASNGILNISKHIKGEHALPNQLFTFQVTGPLNYSQQVDVKADGSTKVDNLLLGDYTVTEIPDPNYDLLGYGDDLDNPSPTPPTVTLKANLESRASAINKVKMDGEFTIEPQLLDGIELIASDPDFRFNLWRSIDDGATWEMQGTTTKSSHIIALQLEETHTFTGLMRGATYKVCPCREEISQYSVVDIQLKIGTQGTVNMAEQAFIHQADEQWVRDTHYAVFIHDMKRMDVSVYKYIQDEFHLFVPDASFRIGRVEPDGRIINIASQVTDTSGMAYFVGLPQGDYVLTESRAPEDFKIIQRTVNFRILMNMSTGDLEVSITGESKHITLTGTQFNVPNKHITPPDANYEGSDKPDGDKLIITDPLVLSSDNPKEFAEKIPSDSGITKLPNAGGLPLTYLSVLGAGFVVAGIIFRRRERKGKDEN